MIYAQQEVVKDLVAARIAYHEPIHFEVDNVSLEALESNHPRVRFMQGNQSQVLDCDFVAGCDGFYGISRRSIPQDKITEFVRDYPFAWLGILAQAPPTEDELV